MIVLSKLEALGMFQYICSTFDKSPGYARVTNEITKLLIEIETWDTIVITAEKQDASLHQQQPQENNFLDPWKRIPIDGFED